MSLALLDEEGIENLTFERSKIWAITLKNLEVIEDGEELELGGCECEELLREEDKALELSPDEEAVEDNSEKEVSLDFQNANASKANISTAELTMMLCAGEGDEAKAEMEEILNRTTPLIQAHKRKWKEAGLDRILDTFDEQQIEQHVGQWLRRHNSIYQEPCAEQAPPPGRCHRRPRPDRDPRADSWPDHDLDPELDLSDNESLHSVDTARYIRQSRRCMTSKLSNQTTIKMYRTHSHKRDELRAKYAYEGEQEHRHHMQALLLRRREKERHLSCLTPAPRHCHVSFSAGSHHSHSHQLRRKHLRKRRTNSSAFESSASEEDVCSFGGCDCRHCRKEYALSRSTCQCCAYRGHREEYRQVASRSLQHLHRCRHHHQDVDMRPRVRENECSCCNSDRLCNQVVHIANSSTEEWVVENNSPLELESPRQCRSRANQMVPVARATPQSVRSRSIRTRADTVPRSRAMASGDDAHGRTRASRHYSFSDHGPKKALAAKSAAKPTRITRETLSREGEPFSDEDSSDAAENTETAWKYSKKPAEKCVSDSDCSEGSTRTNLKHSRAVKASTKQSPAKAKMSKMLPIIKEDSDSSMEFSYKKTDDLPKADKCDSPASEETSKANSKVPKYSKKRPASVETSPAGDSEIPERERVQPQDEPKVPVKRGRTRREKKVVEAANTNPKKPRSTKSKAAAKKTESTLAQISEDKEPVNISPDSQSQENKEKPAPFSDDDLEVAISLCHFNNQLKRKAGVQETLSPAEQSQTIFHNQSVACNSTGLINDTACKRTLRKKAPKRLAPVSSTELNDTDAASTGPEISPMVEDTRKNGDADCTAVSSTTAEAKPPPLKLTQRGVLLHSSSLDAGAGDYTLTEQGLGQIIGEHWARKYLKYHLGNRSFDGRHAVYFQPSPAVAAALTASQKDAQKLASAELDSSASDDDVFDNIHRYGLVYSVPEK
ncbi:hypothetical protein KR018_007603 [Drosophila ironensis]|nr:hypothetical protein KR018_007603 [Drosophila ironensis]